MGQVHAHYCVARLQKRKVDSHVCGAATMSLNVGVFGTKQLLRAITGKVFDFVHNLASTVIPCTWIALSVFVGKNAHHRLANGEAGDILARDQFQVVLLPSFFSTDQIRDNGIRFCKGNAVSTEDCLRNGHDSIMSLAGVCEYREAVVLLGKKEGTALVSSRSIAAIDICP